MSNVAPGNFTLTANATSIGSTIAKVAFYNGTTLLGTATAAPYSYAWKNIPLGTYSLTAVATDALNATTTSAPVGVTVNSGVVQAYYIHAESHHRYARKHSLAMGQRGSVRQQHGE